jgi:hypothetical protein
MDQYETYILPEGEEDDELDAGDLHQQSVALQLAFQLNVELDDAEHGDSDADGFKDLDPNVSKSGAQRFFAVTFEELGDAGDEGEEDANEAVLKDAEPDDIEPGQAALGSAEWTFVLSTGTLLHPGKWPDPIFGDEGPKVFFLVMDVGGNVIADEGEEGGDGEGFVAVAQDFEVDGVAVVEVGEEGDGGVDGDHEQNADNAEAC